MCMALHRHKWETWCGGYLRSKGSNLSCLLHKDKIIQRENWQVWGVDEVLGDVSAFEGFTTGRLLVAESAVVSAKVQAARTPTLAPLWEGAVLGMRWREPALKPVTGIRLLGSSCIVQPLPVLFYNSAWKPSPPYSTFLQVFNVPNKKDPSFHVNRLRDYCTSVETCTPRMKLRAVLSPPKKVLWAKLMM